jgi:hypothetical protein
VERGVDRIRRSDSKERIAVCRRTHDRFGSYIGASTRAILDNELLAEFFCSISAASARTSLASTSLSAGTPRRNSIMPLSPRRRACDNGRSVSPEALAAYTAQSLDAPTLPG